MNMEREIYNVSVDDIIPNRFQPRLAFDGEALQELADSIKEHGIIQPLVLRKLGNKYEIIAGERRYKASCKAGLSHVPAIIVNLDDNVSAEVALVENLQRRDLSAIEEAKSYQKLLDRGYLTQEELAQKMGKSQPTIANKLRLLQLPEEAQKALLDNKISERHARSLLTLKNEKEQVDLLHRIIKERLTVKQTDDIIKEGEEGTETGKEKKLEPVSHKMEVPQSEVKTINIDEILRGNFEEQKAKPPVKPSFDDLLKVKPHTIEPIEQLDIEDDLTGLDLFGGSLSDQLKKRETIAQNSSNGTYNYAIPTVNTVNVNSNMDLRAAINTVRECIANIEKYGFDVDAEEFDFEKMYQIVIKIDKNNH